MSSRSLSGLIPRRHPAVLPAVAAGLLAAALPAAAQEKTEDLVARPAETAVAAADNDANRPVFTLESAYATKYVSRGVLLNDDPVIQSEAAVEWYGFKAAVWGSQDTTGYNDREWTFQEADYTLGYSHTFGDLPVIQSLTLGGGWIYYHYPDQAANSQEVYLEASLDDVFLAPAVTVYYDTDDARAFYINPTVSHTFTLIQDRLELELEGGIGWGDARFNRYNFCDDSLHEGFTDITATAELTYTVNENISCGPFLSVSEVLDNAARAAAKNGGENQSDQIWGGFKVGVTF